MLISELGEPHLKQIRKCFRLFDEDNDGYIETSELGNALRWMKLIPSEAEIAALIDVLDPEHAGRLSLERFSVAAAEKWFPTQRALETHLWNALILFDPNLTGLIPVEKMKDILLSIGTEPIPEKEAEKLLKRYVNPFNQVEYSYMVKELMR